MFGESEQHKLNEMKIFTNKIIDMMKEEKLFALQGGPIILSQVGMIGVHYEDNHVATGFGNHLARPILRDEWHESLSYEEGVKLLHKCMRVLLYRDRFAVNKRQDLKGWYERVKESTSEVIAAIRSSYGCYHFLEIDRDRNKQWQDSWNAM